MEKEMIEVTATLPRMVEIALPKKAGGGTGTVDMTKLYANPSGLVGLLIFAMRQKCGDAVAPETVQGEEATKRVAAKLARFNEGDAADSGTREGDPVEREAWAIAKNRVAAAIRAAGRKVKEFPAEKLDAAARKLLEGDGGKAIYEAAREAVAARGKATGGVELAELGL